MYRVKEFFKENWDQKSPLLLGYSGGPDSKTLLYLLLEMGISPHVAHVDHGWREESAREAEEIKKEVGRLGLPFYTIRLAPVEFSEAEAREKRLEFFASLFQNTSFQALLLAHQADDLAETALKRVLEGAHLVNLGGMRGVSELKGMPIWRPLLEVPRQEILAFLEKRGCLAIQDPTNVDPAYLRARMRVQILPDLARSFGKEISGNLTLLGRRANELKEYLDRKTETAFQNISRGPWGISLTPDLNEPMEIRHLLQRTGIRFSREILDGVVKALLQKSPNRNFGPHIWVDRGTMIFSVNVASSCSGR